jgi:hypothetical protein
MKIGEMRRSGLGVVAVLLAAAAAASVAGADEFPSLPAVAHADVAGTHVSCSVTATVVSCKKAGGLEAMLVKAGTVQVKRVSPPLPATGKHVRLGANGGFVLASQDIYCHVYVEGVRTLTCSLVYSGGGAPRTHGFDISDRSVVVFRYDAAGNRQDSKTFRQP